jgi:hypothetical protein
MDYEFVAEEAKPVAAKLDSFLKKKFSAVSSSQAAWPDAQYRTTFHVVKDQVTMLYEVQERPHIGGQFRVFAQWLAAQRHSAELRIVAWHEAPTAASLQLDCRRNGIGLLVLKEDGAFEEIFPPRNPAFVVTPDPTLRFGPLKVDVLQHLDKFNGGHRKDALRDMCELVEGEIGKTLVKASRKGLCTTAEAVVKGMDLSDQINTLASAKATAAGKAPPIDDKFKTDLHSFRGARNLIDHPARSKRDEAMRQRQFCERMMMGPRLVADLLTIQRKIR